MFEDLFAYPKALARHRAGQSADARERFLAHCAGYSVAWHLVALCQNVNLLRTENPRTDGGTSPMSRNSCAAYSRLIMWRSTVSSRRWKAPTEQHAT